MRRLRRWWWLNRNRNLHLSPRIRYRCVVSPNKFSFCGEPWTDPESHRPRSCIKCSPLRAPIVAVGGEFQSPCLNDWLTNLLSTRCCRLNGWMRRSFSLRNRFLYIRLVLSIVLNLNNNNNTRLRTITTPDNRCRWQTYCIIKISVFTPLAVSSPGSGCWWWWWWCPAPDAAACV